MTVVVHNPTSNVGGQSETVLISDMPQQADLLPRHGGIKIDSVENSPMLTRVLRESGNKCTRNCYYCNWRKFEEFAKSIETYLLASLHCVLHFFYWALKREVFHNPLLRFIHLLLYHTNQWVLVSSSSWNYGQSSPTPFQTAVVKTFLKGLDNIYWHRKSPTPQCSLPIILTQFTKPPFECTAPCHLSFLTYKTAFLVAITSAKCARALSELECDRFHNDKMTLFTLLSYPK